MTATLNFCLTFESGPAALLGGYSRGISLGLASDYVLGPEALPHVTVLKLSAPPEKTAEIWALLEPRLPRRLNLRFYGLSLHPGKNGDAWVQLNVQRTAELEVLQEVAAKVLSPYGIRTAVGDDWWPHVTLLHSLDGRMPADFSLNSKVLTMPEVVAVPALGRNQISGIVTEILARPNF
jgi:2'-5' RNA ligase